jgi:hypothetical protein
MTMKKNLSSVPFWAQGKGRQTIKPRQQQKPQSQQQREETICPKNCHWLQKVGMPRNQWLQKKVGMPRNQEWLQKVGMPGMKHCDEHFVGVS